MKDVPGKGKDWQIKEGEKNNTLYIWDVFRAKTEKEWKVHSFTQQLIIEHILFILRAGGTVVDKIDKILDILLDDRYHAK